MSGRPLKPGWRMVKFGDVVRQCKETVDRENNSFERYVEGGHMDSEDIHIRRWGTFGIDYVGPAFHRIFRKGQVLYGSRRTYLKKIAMPAFDGVTANTTLVLETKNKNILLQELLPFLMLTDPFTKHSIQESKGSTNPYINWPDIAKYEFPLPPIEEQQRIAEILWAADDVVDRILLAQHHSEKARRILLFHCMTEGLGAGFRGIARYGLKIGAWPVCRIEKAGKVQLGRQRAPKYQSGKFTRPYLRVANVFDGFFDLSDVLEMDFDERDYLKYKLMSGDILLNEGQSRELVGRCAFFSDEMKEACFQNTLIRFQSGDALKPEFAFRYFQYLFYRQSFSSVASQTTSMAHLGADTFSRMFMPIPPMSEQEKIIEIMNEFSNSQGKMEKDRLEASRMRRALCNDLIGASHV